MQISTYVLSGCDEQTAGDEDNDSGLEGGSKTIIGGDHLNSDADHHYDDVGDEILDIPTQNQICLII